MKKKPDVINKIETLERKLDGVITKTSGQACEKSTEVTAYIDKRWPISKFIKETTQDIKDQAVTFDETHHVRDKVTEKKRVREFRHQ